MIYEYLSFFQQRGETPLHLAARSNQIDVMKILIDNGATVDACAHENQTPLHIAARLGNAEIVTLLLEKGANADAQTRDQYTALHIAAREGKEDVAAVLLDRGATLSMKTKVTYCSLLEKEIFLLLFRERTMTIYTGLPLNFLLITILQGSKSLRNQA